MEKVLPKGWVLSNIGQVSEIIRGVSYKKGQASSVVLENSTYILRGGNIQDGKLDFETNDNVYVDDSLVNPNQKIRKDDVVIVGSTGSKKLIGKAGIAENDLKTVSFGAFLMLLRTDCITKRYHSYFFQTKYYRDTISDLAGGVNINNIRKEHLENLEFPLPPLPEQERIVAKLDKLSAQHEKIKKALDRIPQLLKTFRQQVLTQAVTGKLTEQWREGKDLEEWRTDLVGNICDTIVPGRDKPKSFTGNIPWITTPDLTSDYLNSSNAKFFLSEEEIKLVRAKKIPTNSVIISVVGRFGIAGIVKEECVINQQLHAYLPSPDIIPEFLLHQMRLKEAYMKNISSSTTIAYINKTKANSIPIKIAPVDEQQEIVRRVESLFTKADTIEARYQALKGKIDNLPQAILHKAFRGELVPQLPNDGDAKDLLAAIMALKEETKGKKRKQSI